MRAVLGRGITDILPESQTLTDEMRTALWHPSTEAALAEVKATGMIAPEGLGELRFAPANDLIFDYDAPLPGHPNGLAFEALDGRLALGTWQSLCLVDLNVDNHEREVRFSFLAG